MASEAEIDAAVPFIVQRWVNGAWRGVARCAQEQDARMVRDALRAAKPLEEVRAIRIRWHRNFELAGAPDEH